MMVFIDWISPPDHANFNRAFFSAIGPVETQCYVFSESLLVDSAPCVLASSGPRRLDRALSVLSLCWQFRSSRIVFLTYDPLFLPLALLLVRPAVMFEHNTTPERLWSKQGIWQRLLFHGATRMAQFHGQVEMLRRMRQRTFFVGTPISPKAVDRMSCRADPDCYFVAPSYRASLSQLQHLGHVLGRQRIVVKRAAFVGHEDEYKNLRIEPVERIDMSNPAAIAGVLITVESRIRGTGWFNDSIALGLPIIPANTDAKTLFQETFPG